MIGGDCFNRRIRQEVLEDRFDRMLFHHCMFTEKFRFIHRADVNMNETLQCFEYDSTDPRNLQMRKQGHRFSYGEIRAKCDHTCSVILNQRYLSNTVVSASIRVVTASLSFLDRRRTSVLN